MLSSSALQKLERYGQLGQKRANMEQFIASSIRDEKQTNVYALTHVESWTEAAKAVRWSTPSSDGTQQGSSTTTTPVVGAAGAFIVSDSLLHAVAFGLGLVRAQLSGDKTNHAAELLPLWHALLSRLRRDNIVHSVAVTEAMSSVLGCAVDLYLDLQEANTNSTMVQKLGEASKDVVVTAARQFSWIYSKSPAPRLLATKSAPVQLKNALKNASSVSKDVGSGGGGAAARTTLLQKLCVAASIDSSDELLSTITSIVSPVVSTKAARFFVYYRGDEHRLSQSGVNEPDMFSAVLHATTHPLDPTNLSLAASQGARGIEVVIRMLRQWLLHHVVVFESFCKDTSWVTFAGEQRKRVLTQEHEDTRSRRKRLAKAQKKAAALPKAGLDRIAAGGSSMLDGGDGDRHSDAGSSTLGTADDNRSLISTMSAESAASFQTFLSVIDKKEAAEEERFAHESADGNTNLPLILLEQLCFAIHSLIEVICDNEVALGADTVLQLREFAWLQLDRLFRSLERLLGSSSSSNNEHRKGRAHSGGGTAPSVFIFADDVRFNKALGYQCLGVIFARILVPVLTGTRPGRIGAQPAVAENSGAVVPLWEATDAISGSVAVCLRVYEALAPQVVNANLGHVLATCARGLHASATAATTGGEAGQSASQLSQFVGSVLVRLGRSNQLPLLIDALVSLWTTPLAAAAPAPATTAGEGEEGAEQQPSQQQQAPSVSHQALAALHSSTHFRRSVMESVLSIVDCEVVTQYLKTLCARVVPCDPDTPCPHRTSPAAVSGLLDIAIALVTGVQPSAMNASSIVEALAEVEVQLCAALTMRVLPCITEDDGEDAVPEEVLLFEVGSCKRRALHTCALTLLQLIVSIRSLVGLCIADLGAENPMQFLSVLDESLWMFSSAPAAVLGEGGPSVDDLTAVFLTPAASSASSPAKNRKADKMGESLDGTASISIITHLAAERLSTGRTVLSLLGKSNKADEKDESTDAAGTGDSEQKELAAEQKKLATFVLSMLNRNLDSNNQKHDALSFMLPSYWVALHECARKKFLRVMPSVLMRTAGGTTEVSSSSSMIMAWSGWVVETMIAALASHAMECSSSCEGEGAACDDDDESSSSKMSAAERREAVVPLLECLHAFLLDRGYLSSWHHVVWAALTLDIHFTQAQYNTDDEEAGEASHSEESYERCATVSRALVSDILGIVPGASRTLLATRTATNNAEEQDATDGLPGDGQPAASSTGGGVAVAAHDPVSTLFTGQLAKLLLQTAARASTKKVLVQTTTSLISALVGVLASQQHTVGYAFTEGLLKQLSKLLDEEQPQAMDAAHAAVFNVAECVSAVLSDNKRLAQAPASSSKKKSNSGAVVGDDSVRHKLRKSLLRVTSSCSSMIMRLSSAYSDVAEQLLAVAVRLLCSCLGHSRHLGLSSTAMTQCVTELLLSSFQLVKSSNDVAEDDDDQDDGSSSSSRLLESLYRVPNGPSLLWALNKHISNPISSDGAGGDGSNCEAACDAAAAGTPLMECSELCSTATIFAIAKKNSLPTLLLHCGSTGTTAANLRRRRVVAWAAHTLRTLPSISRSQEGGGHTTSSSVPSAEVSQFVRFYVSDAAEALPMLAASSGSSTDAALLLDAIADCVVFVSGVQGFQLSDLCGVIRAVMAHGPGIGRIATSARGGVSAGQNKSDHVRALRSVLRVARIPLASVHDDRVTRELLFGVLMAAVLATPPPTKGASTVPQKDGDVTTTQEAENPSSPSLSVSSSALYDEHCSLMRETVTTMATLMSLFPRSFAAHAQMLPQIFSQLFANLLTGLDVGCYGADMPTIVASLLYRLVKSGALGSRAPAFHASCIMGGMYNATERSSAVFTRHSSGLDYCALDLVKVMQRDKLPAMHRHGRRGQKRPRDTAASGDDISDDDEKTSESLASYADLCYVCVGSDDAKSLLRQAILRSRDEAMDVFQYQAMGPAAGVIAVAGGV